MTIINPVKSYQIHTILDIRSALWCAQNIAQYFKRSILVLFLVLSLSDNIFKSFYFYCFNSLKFKIDFLLPFFNIKEQLFSGTYYLKIWKKVFVNFGLRSFIFYVKHAV